MVTTELNSQSTFNSSPSNSYVENATISLVREYLYRKNFKSTLKCLNHEEESFEGLHNHRLALTRELQLEKLVLENKKSTTTSNKKPLHSILEVLVKAFICRRISCQPEFDKSEREIVLSSSSHRTLFKDVGVQVGSNKPQDVVEVSLLGVREPLKSSSSSEKRLSKSTSSIPGHKAHPIRSPDNHPELETVEPLSPPPTQMNFDTEFHIKSRPHQVESQRGSGTQNPEGAFAQNLLQSKRDTLAESWLTKKENKKRVMNEETATTTGTTPPTRDTTDEAFTLEFEDIEDEDFGFSEGPINSGVKDLHFSRNLGKSKSRPLDVTTWKELKNSVVGKNGVVQEGWMSQGFTFDSNIPYGIVQKKGGPCGVLAVVQSLLLRNLMFGSDLCENLKTSSKKLEGFLFGEASVNCYKSRGVNHEWILAHRGDALVGTLVEILWRCRGNQSDPVLLCLEGNQPGLPVTQIETLEDVKVFVHANLYKFDCIGLVYSCVLTRGLISVQEDMDFPNSPLLGQHGYCSQELINLLLFGKCISNAFDNEVRLDDKILKGITSQSDIGLLSLFEHYGSFQVGSNLKSPTFPIWLVCSESHFSVLFSSDRSLTSEEPLSSQFTLFFYDGLARLDDTVRLTISVDETSQGKSSKTVQYVKKGFQDDGNNEDNLVPPLEKCIRTKWNNAVVNWNGIDPIL